MDAPSAQRATASGSPETSSTIRSSEIGVAIERFGERGDKPLRLPGDGRDLEFLKRRRRRRESGTGRAAELHALRREKNLDPLVGPRDEEEKRIFRPDRAALEKRFREPKVAPLFRQASRPSEETDERRSFELSESVARQRDHHAGVVVECDEVRKRGAQRLAPGDRRRLSLPTRDRLFELPVGVSDGMFETKSESSGSIVSNFARRRSGVLALGASLRAISRRVAGSAASSCSAMTSAKVSMAVRVVWFGGDEMVARHPKPDPAISRALA